MTSARVIPLLIAIVAIALPLSDEAIPAAANPPH